MIAGNNHAQSDSQSDKSVFLPSIEQIAIKFLAVTDAATLAEALTLADDFHHASLLGVAKEYSRKSVKQKSLNYYAYHCKQRYKEFTIAKRGGGARTIKAPKRGLKRLQALLNICLNALFMPREAAHGFIPGRNIVTNALPHIGRRYVYNTDLKDFFPSTHFGRVYAVLRLKPFEFSEEVAYLLANLCTDYGSLPQGAPTSPTLTNLVCQRLDRKLVQLAKKNRCTFTRYADDITFSCNREIFTDSFKDELNKILISEGYAQNHKKERLQTFFKRQEVTGVVVNQRTNVTRQYLRQVRAMLHHWEKWGYDRAQAEHVRLYIGEKGILRYNGKIPKLEQVLGGKIEYLGMVRGKHDPIYQRLRSHFHQVSGIAEAQTQRDLQTLEDLIALETIAKHLPDGSKEDSSVPTY